MSLAYSRHSTNFLSEQMDKMDGGWIEGRLDEKMGGRKDEWKNGWKERWMEGWKDDMLDLVLELLVQSYF